MFRKLHVQLTALCAAITALVLAVLSAVCLLISESGIRRQEYDSFLSGAAAMYQSLEQQNLFSHALIRQLEHSYQLSLQLSDNGSPFFFQQLEAASVPDGIWEAVSRRALDDCGLNLKEPASLGALTQHHEFSIVYAGKNWYASAALLPRSGGFVGVMAVRALSAMEQRIFRQRLAFLLTGLAALALLSAFFWNFTARMLRPLSENRKKQIQFVASASHELRSPLTVILSSAAAVRSGIMAGDRQFLDTIDSEGRRMSCLIDDMLQLASADNRTWSIQPSETELDTLLLQTWEQYEPLAASCGLHWDIALPEEALPRCRCDAGRIRQLLSVLIDNAFSYTPPNGTVRLSLEYAEQPAARKALSLRHDARKAPAFFIRVTDNGPGIPDEQKEAVFERFIRLDRSRTDKSHFGLGLCIAQEIARLHGGRILLTDTPGGGATFTVELPAAAL